jgi:hypothetical protein
MQKASTNPERVGALKRNVLVPGQVVVMDHYVHMIPGRRPALGGISLPTSLGMLVAPSSWTYVPAR